MDIASYLKYRAAIPNDRSFVGYMPSLNVTAIPAPLRKHILRRKALDNVRSTLINTLEKVEIWERKVVGDFPEAMADK